MATNYNSSRTVNIDSSFLSPRKKRSKFLPIEVEPITNFVREHWFLSNMYPSPISSEGITYPTAEHAYQAAKSTFIRDKETIAAAPSPGVAKKMGRYLRLRPDWEKIKLEVIETILREKFRPYSQLAEKLVETHPAVIYDYIGEILMKIREELLKHCD